MQRLRKISALLMCAAALVLTGCAHPQLMKPGMTQEHVLSDLGVPDSRSRLDDGQSRWVYSGQPAAQEVWWLIFDKSGKLVRREEVMNRKHFLLISPGVTTQEEVYALFGRCADKVRFELINQTAWMYRFLDDGLFPMACWVQFDTNGVVTEVGYTTDPAYDRDGEFFHF